MVYTNWNSLRTFEWKVRPILLIGSFLAYTVYVGLAAFTWGRILRTLGSTSSWKQHFRIYYISTLANRLPLPFGHIAGRLLLYDERTSKTTVSFASALELSLIALAGITIGGVFRPKSILYLDWWVGIPAILLGLTIVHPRVLKPLLSYLKVHGSYELRYIHTINWLLFYFLIWMVGGVALYLMIISFYPLNFIGLPNVLGAWCLSGSVAILMVFLPVGLGLRELTLGLLLSSILPPGISALIAILSRILFTIFEIVLAGIASYLKD